MYIQEFTLAGARRISVWKWNIESTFFVFHSILVFHPPWISSAFVVLFEKSTIANRLYRDKTIFPLLYMCIKLDTETWWATSCGYKITSLREKRRIDQFISIRHCIPWGRPFLLFCIRRDSFAKYLNVIAKLSLLSWVRWWGWHSLSLSQVWGYININNNEVWL